MTVIGAGLAQPAIERPVNGDVGLRAAVGGDRYLRCDPPNLPPHRAALVATTGLPVIDIVIVVEGVRASLIGRS
jgi:hypothetical protein